MLKRIGSLFTGILLQRNSFQRLSRIQAVRILPPTATPPTHTIYEGYGSKTRRMVEEEGMSMGGRENLRRTQDLEQSCKWKLNIGLWSSCRDLVSLNYK